MKGLIRGAKQSSSKYVDMAYAATDSGVVEIDVATGERKRTFPGESYRGKMLHPSCRSSLSEPPASLST